MSVNADSDGATAVLRRLRANADRLAYDLAEARLRLAEAVLAIDVLDPHEIADVAGMTIPAADRMIRKARP